MELHAVLDEAERRKEAELSRTGRKASLVIYVPVLLLFVWAGVFLLRYHAADDQVQPLEPVSAQAPDPNEMTGMDAFLPKSISGMAPSSGKPVASKLITQEDISFATELLNYCRPPSAWKDEKK